MRRRRKNNRNYAVQSSSSGGESAVAINRLSTEKTRSRQQNYMVETSRPIVCLAFVLPLLLIYELGSIFTDSVSVRSGVDQWTIRLTETLGLGQLFLLPLLTAAALLYWHHRIQDNCSFNPAILLGMLVESGCLGVILFFAGNATSQWMTNNQMSSLSINGSNDFCWASTITYLGCGVYEELIFRLILLGGLIRFGKLYLVDWDAKILATVLTSLLFASLHYDFINPTGQPFEMNEFIFRGLASVAFCVLFLSRGFGIAVGVHAIYDVMTQL